MQAPTFLTSQLRNILLISAALVGIMLRYAAGWAEGYRVAHWELVAFLRWLLAVLLVMLAAFLCARVGFLLKRDKAGAFLTAGAVILLICASFAKPYWHGRTNGMRQLESSIGVSQLASDCHRLMVTARHHPVLGSYGVVDQNSLRDYPSIQRLRARVIITGEKNLLIEHDRLAAYAYYFDEHRRAWILERLVGEAASEELAVSDE
jgi:hypothetical protein